MYINGDNYSGYTITQNGLYSITATCVDSSPNRTCTFTWYFSTNYRNDHGGDFTISLPDSRGNGSHMDIKIYSSGAEVWMSNAGNNYYTFYIVKLI
jgi:hypothetical protein